MTERLPPVIDDAISQLAEEPIPVTPDHVSYKHAGPKVKLTLDAKDGFPGEQDDGIALSNARDFLHDYITSADDGAVVQSEPSTDGTVVLNITLVNTPSSDAGK